MQCRKHKDDTKEGTSGPESKVIDNIGSCTRNKPQRITATKRELRISQLATRNETRLVSSKSEPNFDYPCSRTEADHKSMQNHKP